MSPFERYVTVWIALCIVGEIVLGKAGSIKGDILLILCPADCLGSKHGNNNHLVRLVQF